MKVQGRGILRKSHSKLLEKASEKLSPLATNISRDDDGVGVAGTVVCDIDDEKISPAIAMTLGAAI